MITTTNIDSNATGHEQPECQHNAMLVGPPAKCADCGYRYGIDDKVPLRPSHTLSNFRVEYVKPDYSRGHSFEPRCAILADDAQFDGATVRVFDVPDPDESQREIAQFACDAMNDHGRLVSALRDCVESLKRLPDVDDAYRVTCIRQAERALAGRTD